MGLDHGILARRTSPYEEELEFTMRKENWIHGYFSDINSDMYESGEHKITYADLRDLVDLLEELDNSNKDEDLADRLLPLCCGFFFGNSETYDDYYWEDIHREYQGIKSIVDQTNDRQWEFVYWSWW